MPGFTDGYQPVSPECEHEMWLNPQSFSHGEGEAVFLLLESHHKSVYQHVRTLHVNTSLKASLSEAVFICGLLMHRNK